jgi:hypothetical protein
VERPRLLVHLERTDTNERRTRIGAEMQAAVGIAGGTSSWSWHLAATSSPGSPLARRAFLHLASALIYCLAPASPTATSRRRRCCSRLSRRSSTCGKDLAVVLPRATSSHKWRLVLVESEAAAGDSRHHAKEDESGTESPTR